MEPLIIEVSDLVTEIGAAKMLTNELSMDEFQVAGAVFVPDGPAHLDATLTNSGEAYVLHGTVLAHFTVACSRCLEDFTLRLKTSLDALFVSEETIDPKSEEDVIPYSKDRIDVSIAVEGAIRLELPFAPLHADSCKGICSLCGTNLNEGSCECDMDATEDNPFSSLKGMFKEEDPES